jgi:hypothetical protein
VKYCIIRASQYESCGFDEDAADTQESETADAATMLEHTERWRYIQDDGGCDEYAAKCIETGMPDKDTFVARDERGVLYRVTIHNTPIAINIHADAGKRVSWSHAVVGIEVLS